MTKEGYRGVTIEEKWTDWILEFRQKHPEFGSTSAVVEHALKTLRDGSPVATKEDIAEIHRILVVIAAHLKVDLAKPKEAASGRAPASADRVHEKMFDELEAMQRKRAKKAAKREG